MSTESMKIFYLIILTVVLLQACQLVESENRVIYETGEPVIETQVRQFSDQTTYITYTDYNGTWTLNIPIGSSWGLCIEDPNNDYIEACYNGELTVDETGELKR